MSLVDEVPILNESTEIPGSSQTKRKKEKNYSPEEDVFVCSAWTHTSQDSVKGKDRKDNQFWNRAVYEYNKVRGDYPARLGVSLKNRWSKIQKDVRKFIAILDNLKSLHPSGGTDEYLEKKALHIFASDTRENFKYYNCWVALRDISKFNGDGIVEDDFNIVHESQVPQVNLGNEDGSSSSVIERPIGRKVAKEGEKRKRKSIDMTVAAEKFDQSQAQIKRHHEERKVLVEEQGRRAYDLALKTYELQEKIFEAKQEAREEARLARDEAMQAKQQAANDNAMRIDLTQMTGSSKTYWEMRQQSILASVRQG